MEKNLSQIHENMVFYNSDYSKYDHLYHMKMDTVCGSTNNYIKFKQRDGTFNTFRNKYNFDLILNNCYIFRCVVEDSEFILKEVIYNTTKQCFYGG